MFRIEFDPETGKFIIQVLRFGMLWTAVTGAEFETFDQAQSRVAAIGLNKLYADKSANRYREHMTVEKLAGARGFVRMRDGEGNVIHERNFVHPA